MKSHSFARRLVCAAIGASILAGCVGTNTRPDSQLEQLRRSPGNTPQRNVTDFSAALQCMDETLFAYGTRDVVMMLEELQDNTHRSAPAT